MEFQEQASRRWSAAVVMVVMTLLLSVAASAGRLDGQSCPQPAPDSGGTPAAHDDLVTQFMALPVLGDLVRFYGLFDLNRNVWWALRSQRNLAIDRPVSAITQLASHNSFNNCADGYSIYSDFQPNQGFSMIDQLRIGVRMLELDVYDVDSLLWLHHLGGEDYSPYDWRMAQLLGWLWEPQNANEILFLDIEDKASGHAGIRTPFGSDAEPAPWLFTPQDRIDYGGWPSRRELLGMGKRVILFDHGDLSFGEVGVSLSPDEDADVPVGQTLVFHTPLSFRTDNESDSWPYAVFGNFNDRTINDARDELGGYLSLPESRKSFFTVRGDGQQGGADRMEALDIASLLRVPNVNFIKFDFYLTVEADLDGLSDGRFQMPDAARNFRLTAAVWSWNNQDPAPLRQIFQDLFPGDGTGAALRGHFDAYAPDVWTQDGSSVSEALADLGEIARANGRDYAVQEWDDGCGAGALHRCGRWNSREDANRRFACASASLPALDRLWGVTAASGTWGEGGATCEAEFPGSVFGGPVTAHENHDLLLSRVGVPEEIWINVNDADRDGNWVAEQVPEPSGLISGIAALTTLGLMARRRRE